jgi:hypothetical protein
MLRLNVGAGRDVRPDFINLDSVGLPGIDVVCDLEATPLVVTSQKTVIDDSSIDYFLMSHVIEHFKNPLLAMERLWNWAKDGAVADIYCPYGSSDDAFEDPTHYRQYFLNSFGYFSQPFYFRADYGFRGDWQPEKITLRVPGNLFRNKRKVEMLSLVNIHRNMVREMVVRVRAVKPARECKAELRKAPEVEFELV